MASLRGAVAAYSGPLTSTVHCSFFRSLLVPYIVSLLQAHAQTPRCTLLIGKSCILGWLILIFAQRILEVPYHLQFTTFYLFYSPTQLRKYWLPTIALRIPSTSQLLWQMSLTIFPLHYAAYQFHSSGKNTFWFQAHGGAFSTHQR